MGLSIDEASDVNTVNRLIDIFAEAAGNNPLYTEEEDFEDLCSFDESFERHSDFLTHGVFSRYHSETDMMRYIKLRDRKSVV